MMTTSQRLERHNKKVKSEDPLEIYIIGVENAWKKMNDKDKIEWANFFIKRDTTSQKRICIGEEIVLEREDEETARLTTYNCRKYCLHLFPWNTPCFLMHNRKRERLCFEAIRIVLKKEGWI